MYFVQWVAGHPLLADPTTEGRRAQRGRGSGATDDVFKKSSLILSKEWAYFVKEATC
jgi:hypothetical protein